MGETAYFFPIEKWSVTTNKKKKKKEKWSVSHSVMSNSLWPHEL